MTSDMFYAIIEKTNQCEVEQLRKVLTDLFSDANEYNETRDIEIIDLMNRVVSLPSWIGKPDEFHNLSVYFANKDKMLHAIDVVRQGLRQYPKSTDLLADFIKYASLCGNSDAIEECQMQFEVLISISKKRWTWRAYDFLIDYLEICIDKGIGEEDKLQALANSITDDYIHAFPNDERAYFAKSEFLKNKLEEKAVWEILIQGTRCEQGAPRCLLRLADILFKKKKYEEALKFLNQCRKDALALENSISIGYVYEMLALCKISIIYLHWNPSDPVTKDLEVEIQEVFRDYQSAIIYDGWQSERIQILKKHLDALEIFSGVHGSY